VLDNFSSISFNSLCEKTLDLITLKNLFSKAWKSLKYKFTILSFNSLFFFILEKSSFKSFIYSNKSSLDALEIFLDILS
jgi:hypothetical protein